MLYRTILKVRFQKGFRCVLRLISDVNRIVLILRSAFSSKNFIFRDTPRGKTRVARLQHPSPTDSTPESPHPAFHFCRRFDDGQIIINGFNHLWVNLRGIFSVKICWRP